MSTTEILGRTFSVLTRSVFFVIGLLAIGFLAYVTWVTTEAMDASDISDTWWGGVLVTFHLCFMLCVMYFIPGVPGMLGNHVALGSPGVA